jgi:hypothetical protein
MLEALGYKQGTDFEWADVFTFAATKGLTMLTAETVMTNDHLAVGAVEALAATNMDGDVLLDKLIADGAIAEADAIAAGLKEEVVDFALESVVAWGLRGLMITFTAEVDGDVTIDLATDDITTDGNVAYVVLDATKAQNEEVTVKVTATGKDGIEIDEEEVDVVMQDKVDPTLVSVEATNAKTIVVKYSEPIADATVATAVFDDVKIDDAKLVGTSTLSDDDTTVTYELNTALEANTYVFTSESVTDYAGFVVPAAATTITVVGDDAAPVLVSAEATAIDTVVLTFDEDVDSIGDIVIDGNTYNGGAVAIDGKEVTVTIADLAPSAAFIAVTGDFSDATDVLGNESDDEIEFTFLAPMDDVAPTATASVTSDNYIVVTFSEDVTDLDVVGAYTLTDDDDEDADVLGGLVADISTSDDFDDDDDKAILIDPADKDLDEGNYTLTVGKADIVDGSVLQNKVAEVEFSLVMNDIKVPTVDGPAYIVDATDDIARLSFSEAMDVATLTNINNYLYEGDPLSQVDNVEFSVAADGKSVDITIPGAVDTDELTVFGLKDATGNSLAAGTVATITDAVAFTLATATMTAANTIVVAANADFEIADPNEFEIFEDAAESATLYVTSAVVDGDEATLTLNGDLDADGGLGAAVISVRVTGAADTVNKFGKVVDNANLAIIDEVAPSVEVSSPSATEIVLTFDEQMNATNEATFLADVLLRNSDGDLVTIDPADAEADADGDYTDFTTVTIDVVAGDYTVEILSRNIEDLAAAPNAFGGIEATEITVE